MAYHTKWIDVEVDIDLDDFSDEELLEEIKERKLEANARYADNQYIRDMWYSYTMKNTEQFEDLLREFFWNTIGKTI